MTSPLPIEITTVDGCALRGHLWSGGADWIVLVHDIGSDEDLDRWQPLIPSLAGRGVSVCAIDQRGHGASDGEWADETAIGDVRTMVRFARANGAAFVVVIAAGAAVWAVLGAVESERVDGVVGLSAAIGGLANVAVYPPRPPLPEGTLPNDRGKGEHDRPTQKVVSLDTNQSPSPIVGGEVGVGATSADRASIPRAPGMPKLFVVGSQDTASRDVTARLQRASIGWSLIVTLPTEAHGTALLAGEWLTQVREHISGFVRERRYLARSGATGERGEG